MNVDAEKALRNGDFVGARALCDQILSKVPNDLTALRIKGMAEARLGLNEEAVRIFQLALQVAPQDFLSLEWLQGALMQVGRFREAMESGEKAFGLRPNDLNVLHGLGQACLRAGEISRAVGYLEKANALSPRNGRLHFVLGQAYEKAKRNREALAQYREALALQPNLTDAHDRAVRLLQEDGRFETALMLCKQMFVANPAFGQAYLQAAQALAALDRLKEAESMSRKALELDSGLAAPVANWFQSYGKSDSAQEILQRSVDEHPIQGRAYYGLIKARKTTDQDRPLLTRLAQILDAEKLPLNERLALTRALGKAADDLGEFKLAMCRFDEAADIAKTLYRANGVFDGVRLEAAGDRLLKMVDQRLLKKYAHLGAGSESPIFVVGMIRSGTTLVQQILTSHPNVGDVGELPFWTAAYPGVVDLERGVIREPEFIAACDRYTEVARRFDSGSIRLSNKWPMNYSFLPLLLLAYPSAKIVHVMRNPVDTALSIYMSDLGEPPPEFSYDKCHIVSVYRDYERRMAHWRTMLPASSMYEIRYEDLVSDQELWSRRMIEFCGLTWDDRCLNFYTGKRLVNTPSMLQVRRPIYKTSVEKWRNYEPWLGDLSRLL